MGATLYNKTRRMEMQFGVLLYKQPPSAATAQSMRFVHIMQRVHEFTAGNGFFVHDTPGLIVNHLSEVQIAERHEGVVTMGVNSIKWSFPDAEGLSWAVFCLPVEETADDLVLRVGVNNQLAFLRVKFTGVDEHLDVVTEGEWTTFADAVLNAAVKKAGVDNFCCDEKDY